MANPNPWSKKNVLTFDGGGVRGLYSLFFLQKLMMYIQEEEKSEERDLVDRADSSFSPCAVPPNLSHLEDGKFTPYLPCHYFDYIAGTSTGGLISIMLGCFRMTVEDCIEEYQKLAGLVFGRPRHIHYMSTLGFVNRCKYDTVNFEHVIKNVISRRMEGGVDNWLNARFSTGYGLCRVLVTANQVRPGGVVETPLVFCSYEIGPRPKGDKNPVRDLLDSMGRYIAKLEDIRVWHIARAATGATFYFEPLELAFDSSFHRDPTLPNLPVEEQTSQYRAIPQIEQLEDGGFGPLNNPSKEVHDTLRLQLPGHMSVGALVSIGTARPREALRGGKFKRTIMNAIARLTDPEPVHRHMLTMAEHLSFSYYRLNEPNALIGIQMDSWESMSAGRNTMDTIRNRLNTFCDNPTIESFLRRCANELVTARRDRVRASMLKWKRFALGTYFDCKLANCPDDYCREVDEVKFVAHLKEGHKLSDAQIEVALEECAGGQWTYRGR